VKAPFDLTEPDGGDVEAYSEGKRSFRLFCLIVGRLLHFSEANFGIVPSYEFQTLTFTLSLVIDDTSYIRAVFCLKLKARIKIRSGKNKYGGLG
jgi:hypothetical protein